MGGWWVEPGMFLRLRGEVLAVFYCVELCLLFMKIAHNSRLDVCYAERLLSGAWGV